MSLRNRAHRRDQSGFPRVSGDEPRIIEPLTEGDAFSPRERG